jgi:glyoxylate reductase
MKPKIFVTRRLPAAAMSFLEDHFLITCNPFNRVLTRKELLQGVVDQDGLLPLLTDRMDGEVMDKAGPRLKIIANYAVGFNNIDLPAATARKIAVTNTPGVLTDTTADLTLALLLAVARRIVESDVYTRAGRYKGWAPLLFVGTDIHHKTLGLMGFGRIGTAVARRALGFDMRILYHDEGPVDLKMAKQVKAQRVDKETLLRESDFISLHVPLTPETHSFMGSKQFSLMKPTAFIINTSRGEVINEKALVGALRKKQIAGAALDVYEKEPEISPALKKMPNVVLLPHIGSASLETRTKMGMMAAENLRAYFKGQSPPNCLNPEVLGKE